MECILESQEETSEQASKVAWARDDDGMVFWDSSEVALRVISGTYVGFPDSSIGKESTCNAEDPGSVPQLGRSSGEGKGYPLQYSGLENSMDCIVHGIAKSRTRLSNFHFHFSLSVGPVMDLRLGREDFRIISWIWHEQSSELDGGQCVIFYVSLVLCHLCEIGVCAFIIKIPLSYA